MALQTRRVMKHHGLIDPENIDHYIAQGGYSQFVRALTSMTREEILAEVGASGLVGRGGAAFPTARKWETAMKSPDTPKYMFCNGEEGEPAIYKDRRILESDPHMVLEGMLIAGLRDRGRQGLRLRRRRAPARGRAVAGRDRADVPASGCSARTSSAPTSRSTWRCGSGPGRTRSASRRR